MLLLLRFSRTRSISWPRSQTFSIYMNCGPVREVCRLCGWMHKIIKLARACGAPSSCCKHPDDGWTTATAPVPEAVNASLPGYGFGEALRELIKIRLFLFSASWMLELMKGLSNGCFICSFLLPSSLLLLVFIGRACLGIYYATLGVLIMPALLFLLRPLGPLSHNTRRPWGAA